MSRTDVQPDPLVSSFAAVLSVPLREIYAVLWRVGLVEIVSADPAPHRAPGRRVFPERDSERPSRPSRQRRNPAPAPSRPDLSGYSRATG
nr:Rv1535 domain-containing protein [Mycobacterium szulgai]